MNTTSNLQVSIDTEQNLQENYEALALEVLRLALEEEGPDYLLTKDAQVWTDVLNIDAEHLHSVITAKNNRSSLAA